jgi:hypothetical protein
VHRHYDVVIAIQLPDLRDHLLRELLLGLPRFKMSVSAMVHVNGGVLPWESVYSACPPAPFSDKSIISWMAANR